MRSRDLYQAPISYAAQPKADKRERLYVRAEVSKGRLGISSIHLPCEVIRDYFYVSTRRQRWERQTSLYDILRITSTASLAELRVAFRLRQLELRAAATRNGDSATLERAFNILAQPELRACYDSLLKDPSAPALFPYGGLGSILVAGDRSRDGQTFFATQILSFQPELQERRFHAPLRNFDFYDDRAIYRDARRKLEVTLDQSAMPIIWDATWNRWRHLLGAKVELQGTFVQTGKYRHRNGQWSLVKWETALPSRIHVKVPANIAEQIETARRSYHRFGEFSDALGQIRARIEREPMEREQLRSLCWDLGIPGDFDVAQITWKPDYDPFFYQPALPAGATALPFPREYIFDLLGRDRRRDTAIGSCDVPVFQAPEHRSLPRCLHRHHEGGYPTESCQRGGTAGIPGAGRSRIQSTRLASSLKRPAGRGSRLRSSSIRGRVNMQNETNTKAEIIALLEGRTQVSLENIRQFILDLDERDYMEFLYPSDPDFVEELEARNAEAKEMLETLRDIEGTLRDLDRGKIKIH